MGDDGVLFDVNKVCAYSLGSIKTGWTASHDTETQRVGRDGGAKQAGQRDTMHGSVCPNITGNLGCSSDLWIANSICVSKLRSARVDKVFGDFSAAAAD